MGVALVGAVVALVVARRCCGTRFKAPLTPPTPRLTQYEQPEDTESCRLTADTCGTLPRDTRDTCRALASPRAVSHSSVYCGACSIYSSAYVTKLTLSCDQTSKFKTLPTFGSS